MRQTTSLLTVKTLRMPALPSSGGSSLAQSFHKLGGARNLAGMPAGPDIIARGALRPDLVNVGFTAPPGGIPAQSEEVNRAIEGTYLCTAACNSGTMKLLYLLGCGADPNIHNAKGIYPLHYAIKRLNLRMVRALMRHSAPMASQRWKHWRRGPALAMALPCGLSWLPPGSGQGLVRRRPRKHWRGLCWLY